MKMQIEETAKELTRQATLLYASDPHRSSTMLKRLLQHSAGVSKVLIEVEGAHSRLVFCKLISRALEKAEKATLWLTLAWEVGEVEREDYQSLSGNCIKLKNLLSAVLKMHAG